MLLCIKKVGDKRITIFRKRPMNTKLNSVQWLLLAMGPRDFFIPIHNKRNSQGMLEEKQN